MKRKINVIFFVFNVIFFMVLAFVFWKDKIMVKTHQLKSPLLLSVKGSTENFSLLPRDTVLYFDKKFSNGVSRYWFYVDINGGGGMSISEHKDVDESALESLLASKPSQFDLIKLTADQNLERNDVSGILKSKYLSKSEIQDLLESFVSK